MNQPMLHARGVNKSFLLHLQGGVRLDVLHEAELAVGAGECITLAGASGTGKSSLLKALYGNYLVDGGEILVRHLGQRVDLAAAAPELVLALRRTTIGYVSQFLRAIPRIAAIDLVAEPLVDRGASGHEAKLRAAALLERLGIPSRLHGLPPATFSGGEQQRVNLARTFICPWPILLLDEPTASLDTTNRNRVIDLIREVKSQGCAIVGIFHDPQLHDAVSDLRLLFSESTVHSRT